MNIELLNPNNKDVREKIIENAKYIFKHFNCMFKERYFFKHANRNKAIIYKFNDLKYFDDEMEYLYKCYETVMFSLANRYYNNILNDVNNENSIYHLNNLINKVELNVETYINKDISNTINILREQQNIAHVYLSNLMQTDYDYNDIIIYYLNSKFTDIDETIKDNYKTVNNKITVIYETIKGNYKTLNNKITVIDETNKANYETLNNKITVIDETIKNNYEFLNNKITDIKNNYEFLNSKIINIEKTIKYNYDTLNLKINCVIFIIFIMILI
jgi:hypothetical protein